MIYKEILLIDDDAEDNDIFIDALNSLEAGIKCRIALNPSTALAELKTAEVLPDLIFLDYNMPFLNGLQFLQKMREIEELKHIRVILISTPPEEVMDAWLEKNNTAVEYISKPSNFEDLIEMLRELIM